MNREQCAKQFEQDDEFTFHKLRYLNDRDSVENRVASGEWLLAAGFIGLDGKQILPFGRLPK
jgi:hypothetical protein